jgi:hypothetical protein
MARRRSRLSWPQSAGGTLAGLALILAAASGPLVVPVAALASQPAGTTGWRVTKAFATANLSLDSIVALSDGTAWSGGSSPAQTPVLYHYASGHWHGSTLPGSTGTFVESLSATSPANVWACLANEPDVARLTAQGWKLKSFVVGTDQILMDAVLTFGPRNTWAFAYDENTKVPYAYHFNGSSWPVTTLPGPVDANSLVGLVSASSVKNIWAITSIGPKYETLRYNGHHWQIVKLPANLDAPKGQTANARQILALSPTNVWVAAWTASTSSQGPVILLHWNGQKWRKATGQAPHGALTGAIASDGHGGVWLGGDTPGGKPLMIHYAGGHWSTSAAPKPPAGVLDVSQLTLIPGTRAVLGVAVLSPVMGTTKGAAIIKYGP